MNTFWRILAVSAVFTSLRTTNAQQTVYPLHIGDRWQYTVQPQTARIDRDSLMPNAQRYALIKYGFGRTDRWERVAGNQVFWYNPQTGQEYLWYDFSLTVGDTVNIIPRTTDSTIIYFTGTGTYNLFGATRRWWYFWIDYVTRMIDDEEGIIITDSLGMTYISAMWYSTSIMGAIINGMQYGTITHVGEPPGTSVLGLHLAQNYPNPFNPTTTITFETPVSGPIKLSLFDLLGREVALVTKEVVSAGMHRVQFDGSSLASGVYIYRLSTETGSSSRKLIIQK